ncbi:hypothetical protein RclHR1_00820006 [Rhizophagus clarus]|uniref:Uncharacterized protein n=1 Tax=Rhizophagus clarus TaxID=94130 RepID=A0A2Z6SN18_9GLOM|nr:hypothetical protein RclHR1_00820006 [Rhizophagus clarus]
MERSLITYSAPQSVDCLGQIHKWTDTDVVFSYKEICKQLENVSKQLKQQEEESALRAEEKRLIRLKNALWRRMGLSIGYIGKENKFVSPKALKW